MQNRKGIIYPRIVEEVVDYAELQEVWHCSYLTAYRIMHGQILPNHKRKDQLAEYLGIPTAELWVKSETVVVGKYRGVSVSPSEENSEIISEL